MGLFSPVDEISEVADKPNPDVKIGTCDGCGFENESLARDENPIEEKVWLCGHCWHIKIIIEN